MALGFAQLREIARAKATVKGAVASVKAAPSSIGTAAPRAIHNAQNIATAGLVGAAGYYGVAKPAYSAINQSVFEPYSMRNPRSVSTEGTMASEPMLFNPAIREQYRKGMTPGQFADNGDLTLSLNNLRRG
jgi:hypothetical protein